MTQPAFVIPSASQLWKANKDAFIEARKQEDFAVSKSVVTAINMFRTALQKGQCGVMIDKKELTFSKSDVSKLMSLGYELKDTTRPHVVWLCFLYEPHDPDYEQFAPYDDDD